MDANKTICQANENQTEGADREALREIIFGYAKRFGLICGICCAAPLDAERVVLKDSRTPFVVGDVIKRTDPQKSLRGAKCAVVAGLGSSGLKRLVESEEIAEDEPYGELSSLAVLEDYHAVLKKHLRRLADLLSSRKAFKFKILVDGGALNERALAIRAGLGFSAKNGSVVSPEFGPDWHIGCLLLDIDLTGANKNGICKPDAELNFNPSETNAKAGCPPDCRLCADACPTGALTSEDPLRCVSYLTQKDGELTEAEQEAIGAQLYGCDICRRVCPHSKGNIFKTTLVRLSGLTEIDAAGFDRRFGKTAANWKGAETIKRNARAVLRNWGRRAERFDR